MTDFGIVHFQPIYFMYNIIQSQLKHSLAFLCANTQLLGTLGVIIVFLIKVIFAMIKTVIVQNEQNVLRIKVL